MKIFVVICLLVCLTFAFEHPLKDIFTKKETLDLIIASSTGAQVSKRADQYQIIQGGLGGGCPDSVYVVTLVSTCVSVGCTKVPINGTDFSTSLSCSSTFPSLNGKYFGYASYSDDNCTTYDSFFGIKVGGCQAYAGTSYSISCSGTNVTGSTYTDNDKCTGTPIVETETLGVCLNTSSTFSTSSEKFTCSASISSISFLILVLSLIALFIR